MIYAPVHTVGETGYLIPSLLQITHGREQGCLGVTDKAGSDSVVLGSMLRQLPGVSWQIVGLPNLVCTKYSEDCEDSDLAGVLGFFPSQWKAGFPALVRGWLLRLTEKIYLNGTSTCSALIGINGCPVMIIFSYLLSFTWYLTDSWRQC